jgi:hypothetical protein
MKGGHENRGKRGRWRDGIHSGRTSGGRVGSVEFTTCNYGSGPLAGLIGSSCLTASQQQQAAMLVYNANIIGIAICSLLCFSRFLGASGKSPKSGVLEKSTATMSKPKHR